MPQRPPQRAPWPPFPSFGPDGGVVEGASPEVNTKQRRRTKKEGFLLPRSSAPPPALWRSLPPCLTEGEGLGPRRRRRAMVDVFSGRLLLDRRGAAVEAEQALENKVVGLYFSAAWCSLCREFTPLLADFYAELVGVREAPFQVVFVSSDRSPEEMAASLRDSHGDWLALPFHDPLRQLSI
ncbi:nucleoredoxin-like protein 2 isoform X2 [Sceloporus undulatus]|uniref:nucleoredoxin-like protein 2 isoform X2 n=1 Tax=Sceloporus undulatus TaxID=8520 RepID=UPI001C4DD502|nr:nucleoredoxin-like protein 2 isoform X2 [Sceloporus undulatus]